MRPRKELCIHFQRGSCKYGDRCRYLHAAPQQSKLNPFGFGMQSGTSFQHTNQQQQMPNPFGFGVQNNRGGSNFGSKPNQFTWTRSPANDTNNTPALRQSDQKPPAANHICTDSASCQRIIVDDHEKEEPQWKLTCYGHSRNGPCDIVGDTSFEESRALAYDDAKNGKGLQFITERERSLLNSKLVEFQNLAQKPYTVSSVAASSTRNPFAAGSATAPTMNSGVSTPASSFGQLNASLNTGSTAAPNYTFGQSRAFQNHSQPFSMMNNSSFNNSGAFGSQPLQSSYAFGSAIPSNNSTSAQKNPFSTLANSSQTGNASDSLFNLFSDGSKSTSSAIGQSSVSIQSINNKPKENTLVDDSIWSKAEWKWNVGEIPEDAPQDIYIH